MLAPYLCTWFLWQIWIQILDFENQKNRNNKEKKEKKRLRLVLGRISTSWPISLVHMPGPSQHRAPFPLHWQTGPPLQPVCLCVVAFSLSACAWSLVGGVMLLVCSSPKQPQPSSSLRDPRRATNSLQLLGLPEIPVCRPVGPTRQHGLPPSRTPMNSRRARAVKITRTAGLAAVLPWAIML
jgi:hypothetical protein